MPSHFRDMHVRNIHGFPSNGTIFFPNLSYMDSFLHTAYIDFYPFPVPAKQVISP